MHSINNGYAVADGILYTVMSCHSNFNRVKACNLSLYYTQKDNSTLKISTMMSKHIETFKV